MSAWAKPGVKCQCVDAAGTVLVKGRVYTVRALARIDPYGFNGLLLEEQRSPFEMFGYGFKTARFRPLITKTQSEDVALFQHILDGLPVGERA